jgi:polysaccharide pyruvyl transferase WcaK-like protein
LRMANYRSYRDQAAFDYLRGVGFDTTGDRLYPDLVFSLPLNLRVIPGKTVHQTKEVGLGLINYYGWQYDSQRGEGIFQEYIAKIKRFVTWLLEEGYAIRIISGDAIDQRPVDEVVEHVKAAGNAYWQEKLFVEQISSVDELFSQLALTDIVVASRFHNLLCSLMLGLPVVSLGYHEKNAALMKEMGLAIYCQHIEDFTFERLVEQFKACVAGGKQLVSHIHRQCEQYRDQLDEQYRDIFSLEMVQ